MSIEFDFGTIVLFGLISQGVFASLVLAFKEENRKANRYLSLLVFLLSLWLFDSFFRVSGVYGQAPGFYFLPIYFSLGFGPLIFFYTKSLTQGAVAFRYREAVHFVPVLVQFLFYGYLQTRDYGFRREFWFNVHRPYTYDLELILSFASLLVYLIWSRRFIVSYTRKIGDYFSSTRRITLRWLNSLHIGLSILSFFWLLEAVSRLMFGFYPVTPFSAMTIGAAILFIAVGGILQQDLNAVTDSLQPHTGQAASAEETEAAVDPATVERIQAVMAEGELFLRQELSLKEFAKEAGMTPREISRAINAALKMTFIDFVNQYRVQRFKQLAKSKQHSHLSLAGIAYESGFNSKSTFNRVFKKMEGNSPSDYLKEAQNEQ